MGPDIMDRDGAGPITLKYHQATTIYYNICMYFIYSVYVAIPYTILYIHYTVYVAIPYILYIQYMLLYLVLTPMLDHI